MRQIRWAAIPSMAVDASFAALGLWWAYAVGCVYLGLSYDAYRAGLLPITLAGIALLAALVRPIPTTKPRAPATPAPLPRRELITALAGGALFGLWHVVPGLPLALPAALAAVLLFPFARRHPPGLAPPLADRGDAYGLLAAGALLLLFVATVHHPIQDDAYHVNAILTTLEHPERALLSFDGMHGDPALPLQQPVHRPQTHEIAVATLADLSGIDGRTLYWSILPLPMAVLVVLATWRLLRAWIPRAAGLGVLLAVLLSLAWGESLRTYGSYTVIRLFEGKAFFVAAVVPAVIYAAARQAHSPSTRHFALLLLTMCSGPMFSSSALVIAPITAVLGALPFLGTRKLRAAASVLVACAPLLAVLLLVRFEIAAIGGLRSDGWTRDLYAVIGTSARGPFTLALLTAAPLVRALHGSSGTLERYACAVLLLIFNGITAPLLGHVAALFSWRLYWAVPLPALAGGLLAALTLAAWERLRYRAMAPVGLALVLAAFFGAGTRTWDFSRHTRFRLVAHRIPDRLIEPARLVIAHTTPDDLALLPPRLAEQVAQLDARPKLLSIREQYLVNLARYWGDRETRRRMRLMMLVDGTLPRVRAFRDARREVHRMRASVFPDDVDPRAEVERAWNDLGQSAVTFVAFKGTPDEDRLASLGFERVAHTDRYRFYRRIRPR